MDKDSNEELVENKIVVEQDHEILFQLLMVVYSRRT
jgi:hypothetical protein